MSVAIILLCVFIAGFSWVRERNVYNPLFLFSAFWGVIIFGSQLQLYSIFKPIDTVYLIYAIGVASFGFGCILVTGFKKKHFPDNIFLKSHFIINSKVFYTLSVITCVIVWSAAIPTIRLLLSGTSFYQIRYVMIDQIQQSQNSFLLAYLALPFTHVMLHVSVIEFFLEKKKKILFLTIFVLIGVVLTNGARIYLLYYLIDILVVRIIFKSLFLTQTSNKSEKRKKRKSIYMGVLTFSLLTGMVYISLLRKSDVLRTIYVYIVGTVPHMSQRIEQFHSINKYTYGLTSFQGGFRPIFSLFEKAGINSALFELSNSYTNLWQTVAYISSELTYNYFVSLFMYFYVDFGFFGVFLGCASFGFICSIAYKKLREDFSMKSLAIYLMLVQAILVSMMRFQFSDIPYSLGFIYLFLVLRKQNNTKTE